MTDDVSIEVLGFSHDEKWEYVVVPEDMDLCNEYEYLEPEDGEPIYSIEQLPTQRKVVLATNVAKNDTPESYKILKRRRKRPPDEG